MSAITTAANPRSFSEASHVLEWRQAMDAELHALALNNTWTITKLPPGYHAIGCRWVYRIKYNSNGSISRYKARFVAKGYTQLEGLDYFDTYAPVAKMVTVHCLFHIAIIKG